MPLFMVKKEYFELPSSGRKDIELTARAFGAYPGHERWSTVADLNSDYQIDIRDIVAVARMFSWVCLP